MLRLTVKDLELFPDPIDDTRYELINGELYVSRQPDLEHQYTCAEFVGELFSWNRTSAVGLVLIAPGIIFSPDEAVAPDVVWVSRGRYPLIAGADKKLHGAPELVVEVLSSGTRNETRDLDVKLDLYSRYGVAEYWVADWRDRTVRIYRRQNAQLTRVATLAAEDTLTSPLLPGFAAPVVRLFPDPSLLP